MGVIVVIGDAVGVAVAIGVVGRAIVVLLLVGVFFAVVTVSVTASELDEVDGEFEVDNDVLGDGSTDAGWLVVKGRSRFL